MNESHPKETKFTSSPSPFSEYCIMRLTQYRFLGIFYSRSGKESPWPTLVLYTYTIEPIPKYPPPYENFRVDPKIFIDIIGLPWKFSLFPYKEALWNVIRIIDCIHFPYAKSIRLRPTRTLIPSLNSVL